MRVPKLQLAPLPSTDGEVMNLDKAGSLHRQSLNVEQKRNCYAPIRTKH